MICIDCGEEVLPKNAWSEVVGFARPRVARGENSGSSLIDRRHTGRVICGGCATDRIYGKKSNAPIAGQTGLGI